MSTVKWAGWTSRGTVLTTELDALADTTRSAAGTEVDNGTNKDRFGKLELAVTFGANTGAGSYVEIYMVTAPGGTTYEDGSDSVDPGAHKLIDRIPLRATTAYRVTGRTIPLEPSKTKFLLMNQSGQPFPADSSTVTLYTTNEEMVA